MLDDNKIQVERISKDDQTGKTKQQGKNKLVRKILGNMPLQKRTPKNVVRDDEELSHLVDIQEFE